MMKLFRIFVLLIYLAKSAVKTWKLHISAELAASGCPNKISCDGSLEFPFPNLTFPLWKIMQASPANDNDTLLLFDQATTVGESELLAEKSRLGVQRIIFENKDTGGRRKKLIIAGNVKGDRTAAANITFLGEIFAFNLSSLDLTFENIRISFKNIKYKAFQQSFVYLPKGALNCKVNFSNVSVSEEFLPFPATNIRNNSNALLEISRKTSAFEISFYNTSFSFNFTADTLFLAVFNMTDDFDSAVDRRSRVLSFENTTFAFDGRADLSTPKGVVAFSLIELSSASFKNCVFRNAYSNHSIYFNWSTVIMVGCSIVIGTPKNGAQLNFFVFVRQNSFSLADITLTGGLTAIDLSVNNTVLNLTAENIGEIRNMTTSKINLLDVLSLNFSNKISVFSSQFLQSSARIFALREQNTLVLKACGFFSLNNAANYSAVYMVLNNSLILTDSTFFNVGSPASFYSIVAGENKNNAEISSSVFKECSAQIGGCLQFKDYTNLTITHCTFMSNRALSSLAGGGAIFVGNYSNFLMNNTFFYNHTALTAAVASFFNYNNFLAQNVWILLTKTTATDGQGLYLRSNNKVLIKTMVALNGASAFHGGMILLNTFNELAIQDILLINVSSTQTGSAVRILDNSFGNLTSVTIINAASTLNGGAFLLGKSSKITLAKVQAIGVKTTTLIASNQLNTGGGFAYLDSNSVFSFFQVIVVGSSTQSFAGAFSVRGLTTLNMDDFIMINCYAKYYGGFLLVVNAGNIQANRLFLFNVSAEDSGGMFFIDVSTPFCSFNNSFFLFGSSGYIGGLAYSRDPWPVTINNCVFLNFTSTYGAVGLNEIYRINQTISQVLSIGFLSVARVTNCIFENVTADYGGSLYSDRGATITFINNTFFRLRAYFEGAVLLDSFSTKVYIENCTFRDTKANKGGAINIKNKNKLTLVHSTFYNVTSNSKLGGLIFSLGNSDLNISKCRFLLLTETIIADDSPPFTMDFYMNVVEMSPLFSLSEVFTFQSMDSQLNFTQNTFSCTSFKDFDTFMTTTNERPTIHLSGNMFSLNLRFKYFLYIDHTGFSINVSNLNSRRMKLRAYSFLNVYPFQMDNPISSHFSIKHAVLYVGESNNLFEAYLLLNSATSVEMVNTTIFVTKEFSSNFLKSSAVVQHNLGFNLTLIDSLIINNDKNSRPYANEYSTSFFNADDKLSHVFMKGNLIKLGNTLFQSLIKTKAPKRLDLEENMIFGNRFERSSPNLGLFSLNYDDERSYNSSIVMKKNKLCYNLMQRGTVLSIYLKENKEKLIHLNLSENEFLSNRATKGGAVVYLNTIEVIKNPDEKEEVIQSLVPNISKNKFDANRAPVGPILFLDQIKSYPSSETLINALEAGNKITRSRATDSVGDYSSSINYIRISRYTLLSSEVFNTDPVTIEIREPIKNNLATADCFFYITCYDTYGQITKFNSILERNNYTFNGEEEPMTLTLDGVKLSFSLSLGALCAKRFFLAENLEYTKTYKLKIDPHFSFKNLGQLSAENNPDMTVLFKLNRCQQGEYLNLDDLTCRSCRSNTYSLESNLKSQVNCKVCSISEKFNCYGKDQRSPKSDYWRSRESSNRFLRCPNSLSCLGDPDFRKNITSTDCLNCSVVGVLKSESIYEYRLNFSYSGRCLRGYEGTLCAECKKPEYGQGQFYQCLDCESESNYAKDIIIIILKTALIVFVTKMFADINEELAEWFSETQPLSRSFKKKIERSFLWKILLQHVQVLLIIKSLPLKIVPELETFLSIVLELASPNYSTAYSNECFLRKAGTELEPAFFRLYFAVIFALGLMIVLLVLSAFGFIKSNSAFGSEPSEKSFRSFLNKVCAEKFPTIFIVFITVNYVGLVEPYLDQFLCVNIGDDQKPETEDMRLIKDLSITCFSARHLTYLYVFAIPMTFLVGFLLPAFITYKIFKAKSEQTLKSSKFFKLFGFCFIFYKKERLYYESLMFMRKLALVFTRLLFVYAIVQDETNAAGIILFFILVGLFLGQQYLSPYKKNYFDQIQRMESISNVINVANVVAVQLRILSFVDGTEAENILIIIFISFINFAFLLCWLYYYFLAHKTKVKSFVSRVGTRFSLMSIRSGGTSPMITELVSPLSPRRSKSPANKKKTLPQIQSMKRNNLLKSIEVMKAQLTFIQTEEKSFPTLAEGKLDLTDSFSLDVSEEINFKSVRVSRINSSPANRASQIISEIDQSRTEEALVRKDDGEILHINLFGQRSLDTGLFLISKRFVGKNDEEAYLELDLGISDYNSSLTNIELIDGKRDDWAVASLNKVEVGEGTITRSIKVGVRYMGDCENLLKGVPLTLDFVAVFSSDSGIVSKKRISHTEILTYLDFVKIVSKAMAGCFAKEFTNKNDAGGKLYSSPSFKLSEEQLGMLRTMIDEENQIENYARLTSEYTLQITYRVLLPFADLGVEVFRAIIKLTGLMIIKAPLIKNEEIAEKMVEFLKENLNNIPPY